MAKTDNTEKTQLSPQGYYYEDSPTSQNPFWLEDGETPIPIGAYVKSMKLNYDESTGLISLTYTDNDNNEHTLTPSWNQAGGSGTGEKGEKGDKGDKGDAGAAATVRVGTTTTGAAGTNASVTNSGTENAAILNFTIPRGNTGAQGEKGDTGADGAAASVQVGAVETLPAGSAATVTNSGTENAAVLNFGIPEGKQGEQGEKGADGSAASVTVTNTLGGTLEQDINGTKTNYPVDYVTDVVSKDTAIADATETEVENDIAGATPQIMSVDVSTAARTDESNLSDSSHNVITGTALETSDAGSSAKYLLYLVKVFSNDSGTFARYYRPSTNEYVDVKLQVGGGGSMTNEASGTYGVNKVTVGETSAYILTEPKEIVSLTQETDSATNTTTTNINMAGTDQSGAAVSESLSIKNVDGAVSLVHNNLEEETQQIIKLNLLNFDDSDVGLWAYENGQLEQVKFKEESNVIEIGTINYNATFRLFYINNENTISSVDKNINNYRYILYPLTQPSYNLGDLNPFDEIDVIYGAILSSPTDATCLRGVVFSYPSVRYLILAGLVYDDALFNAVPTFNELTSEAFQSSNEANLIGYTYGVKRIN